MRLNVIQIIGIAKLLTGIGAGLVALQVVPADNSIIAGLLALHAVLSGTKETANGKLSGLH